MPYATVFHLYNGGHHYRSRITHNHAQVANDALKVFGTSVNPYSNKLWHASLLPHWHAMIYRQHMHVTSINTCENQEIWLFTLCMGQCK